MVVAGITKIDLLTQTLCGGVVGLTAGDVVGREYTRVLLIAHPALLADKHPETITQIVGRILLEPNQYGCQTNQQQGRQDIEDAFVALVCGTGNSVEVDGVKVFAAVEGQVEDH